MQLYRTGLEKIVREEVRRMAIQHLSQTGDPRALEFFKEILSK